ncbi:MAG: orotate phosphoribosyltransferase [Betaproteobacteria bacterium]|nr:MAG: orotate phosphoribosyltransferase [Betaproteobacteria bacterium]
MSSSETFRQDFLKFALACDALRFGEFKTKSGRLSPYFFNSGQFNTGAALGALGGFFSDALSAAQLSFDMVYGPAYKGIPLVSTLAIGLAAKGHNVPYAFNRKEAKDHGEGGLIVGAPLTGRVVIVDDVVTAGTSVRESVAIIREHGATPAGVLVMVDRMERGTGEQSAVQQVQLEYNIPVIAIATLNDVMALVSADPALAAHQPKIEQYRAQYGVN